MSSSQPAPGPERPARRRRPSRPVLALLVLAAALLGGSSGAVGYFMPVVLVAYQQTGQPARRTAATPVPTARAPSPSPAALPATAPPAGSGSEAPFTVLLLGSDDDSKFTPDHLLTQSMILVRVVPATRQVTMLSIPQTNAGDWS